MVLSSHACLECRRKAAAVGGLLFRCEWCTNAFCEDHLPIDAELVDRCERYERLGMRHPDQACYIHCQEQCKEIAKEKKLEAAQAAAAGGEGRARKKKSPPGSAKQRGGGEARQARGSPRGAPRRVLSALSLPTWGFEGGVPPVEAWRL